VLAGKPDNANDYEEIDVDGIKVYVSKSLSVSPNGIKINLKGFAFFKSLVLSGVS